MPILISTNILDTKLDCYCLGNVYSFSNGFGRNVIIFGVDMSSSVYGDNKGKDILIFGKGPMQGLSE